MPERAKAKPEYFREKAAHFRLLATRCDPSLSAKILEVAADLETEAAEIETVETGLISLHRPTEAPGDQETPTSSATHIA